MAVTHRKIVHPTVLLKAPEPQMQAVLARRLD